MAHGSQPPDHYKTLGISQNAPPSEVKKAYRREVAKYHPDKHHGNDLEALAQERLAALNEAYTVLSDAAKRRQYDLGLGAGGGRPQGPFAAGPRGPNAPPRFLRPLLVMLGITGFGFLMKFLRNPKVWLIVAGGVALVWTLSVYRRKKGD
jgi:hypothetical protein